MKTTIANDFLQVTILHKGAELCSLKSSDIEYIWEGNPTFWGKHSPILFPIVGTLKNNSYNFENKEYQMFRHGFARDLNFDLVAKSNTEASFSLKNSESSLLMYPFEFELIITYILDNRKLKIQYDVRNFSNKTMPFSIGAHPAFSLKNDFQNYSLDFEHEELLECHLLDGDLLSDKTEKIELVDKKMHLNYNLFENDALVFKHLKSKTIAIAELGNPFLRINFSQFPNLGIWTKKDAPFICLEPWFGFADEIVSSGDLLEKNGIILLDKKSEWQAEFNIEIV
jgi:galactose mutarotase-like enzyme